MRLASNVKLVKKKKLLKSSQVKRRKDKWLRMDTKGKLWVISSKFKSSVIFVGFVINESYILHLSARPQGKYYPPYFDMLVMVVKLLIERFGCRCSKPTYPRTPEFKLLIYYAWGVVDHPAILQY